RARAEQRRMDRHAELTAERSGQNERLEREAIGPTVDLLDEDQDHDSTPRRWSSSTTAGAASGPVPITSAAAARSSGRRSPVFVGPAGRCSGSTRSISFFRARSRPGTEGYRGRLMPSLTPT